MAEGLALGKGLIGAARIASAALEKRP